MSSLFIIAKEQSTAQKLQSSLSEMGFDCSSATLQDKVVERIQKESPELVMLEMDGYPSQTVLHELTHGGKVKVRVPIIALVNAEHLSPLSEYAGVDDFVLWPYDPRELTFRVKRLLQKNTRQDEVLELGDLVMDLANCEVRVKGKVVELTFKEYELLKFLARDRGRVFSREALLNKVWGYDYFGGDRTVDVHVRRLRSKIELSGQTFIETVRNIGYRFKKRQ
jgi:two-component system, OmpR family, alkaline phosphatase synthesis response regulator PhoP